MGRARTHAPLNVFLNDRLVGALEKEPSGLIAFRYDATWLSWENALPISMSLPLQEAQYRGAPVISVFENLLPDSDTIRRRVAEKVGAYGTDAYSLLAVIGRDCVGALQFLPEGRAPTPSGMITAETLNPDEIASTIRNLARAPLGLDADDDFRISVAGAQEKTALLFHEGRWKKPKGTTPTTHIFKPQIGELPNGIDLSNSVENEFYCLNLLAQFGLKTPPCTIEMFGDRKVLIIERFDRLWTNDKRLIRLPQEDCCQALGIPPTLKYQSDGGPTVVKILNLLKGSNTPEEDQRDFLKAQILFWLIGATDGHGKNFSVHLGAGGRYRMTPLYDVLSAQPSLAAGQIQPKQMKLAMSIGDNKHYRIKEIVGRHFWQSGRAGGMSDKAIRMVIETIADGMQAAFAKLEAELPHDFPASIHEPIKALALSMRDRLTLTGDDA